jgi:hypothetical protein
MLAKRLNHGFNVVGCGGPWWTGFRLSPPHFLAYLCGKVPRGGDGGPFFNSIPYVYSTVHIYLSRYIQKEVGNTSTISTTTDYSAYLYGIPWWT